MTADLRRGRVGVVFDLDETLIDRQASILDYAGRFHDEFEPHIRFPRDTFLRRFVELDDNGYTSRDTFFESLAGLLGSARLTAAQIGAHFLDNAWTSPSVMDGAECALRTLREAGLPLGIVTNGGSRNQRNKLRNTGLEGLVDHVVISEEFGSKKPDPAIFREICRRLGVAARDSWLIGDHPLLDVVGASRAGFRTIWLQRSLTWPEAHERCYHSAVTDLRAATAAVLSSLGR